MSDLQDRLRRVQFIVCDVDGVLTDGRIWFDGDGVPFRAVYAKDGTAMTLWHLAGGKSALVSGLGSKAIETIAAQWTCTECRMWTKDKARVCRELAQNHGLTLDEMAFVGDDIIDLKALREVGLAVVVSDAAEEVKEVAHLVTKAPGGKGAVRELIRQILDAKGILDSTIKAYCDRQDGPQ